jgi:hypothetical protein
MKKDQIIYPKCMDKTKPKATYITHDGYVRPCCFLHRHNQVEADERWLNDKKHNLHSGKSLQQIFDTNEYKNFFERLKTGKDIPARCIDICKSSKRSYNSILGSHDNRKEKYIEGLVQYQEHHNENKDYENNYSVKHKLQIDATHRCSLSCSKCNRFIENFKDHYSGETYKFGHQAIVKNEISVEHFKMILEEVRAVADRTKRHKPDVDFCGTWSDAIYHPDFLKLIKVAKDYEFTVSIATNGSRKKDIWWDELYSLLEPKYDTVTFGMDGLKDTAHIYRKNIVFDDVVYAMKKGSELGFDKNTWQFIVFNFNQHQVNEAINFAKDIGINFEVVKSNRWDGPEDPLIPTKEWLPKDVVREYNL